MELNTEQKKLIRNAIEAELYSRSFYDFVKEAVKVLEPSTNFKYNWHLEHVCEIAQQQILNVVNGVNKETDFIINVPPRSMKSIIWSICLNAWTWTFAPQIKFMTISYSDVLASTFSYKTRLLIQSKWYVERWGGSFEINSDDNRKTSYSNNKGGTRESFGTGGSITGSGADVIIIDDIQKVSDVSEVKLTNTIETYRDTIFNRLNDPNTGLRFIVGQRTDEGDLAGHLLTTQPDQYEHVCIPMELCDAVKPVYLKQFYTNDLLWEERFSHKVVNEYKVNLGSRTYTTQYQQAPSSNEGTLIKRNWFNVIDYNILPEDKKREIDKLKWEMFIDTAYTDNVKNDASAVLIGAKYNNDVIVKKVFVYYLEFPELCKKIIELSALISPNARIFIEPKASGLSIVQQLKRETQLNIVKLDSPKDSKVVRVNSITPKLEAGRCILMKDPSNSLFLQQVTAFPHSKADDIVDVLYYLVDKYIGGSSTFNYGMI